MNKKWVQSNLHGQGLHISQDNVNNVTVDDSTVTLKEANNLKQKINPLVIILDSDFNF
jgi:hypothetical protein